MRLHARVKFWICISRLGELVHSGLLSLSVVILSTAALSRMAAYTSVAVAVGFIPINTCDKRIPGAPVRRTGRFARRQASRNKKQHGALGVIGSRTAMPPATCGHAMDVPDMVVVAESLV